MESMHAWFEKGRMEKARSRDLASRLLHPLSSGGLAIRNTLEFLLSPTHEAAAAQQFFQKTLGAAHTVSPGVITVDKNAAYPKALSELKATGELPESCDLRQVQYLNTIVEQDHCFIKRRVKPGLSFFSLETAWSTLQGYESMNIIRKGQVYGVEKGDILGQVAFIARLFGVAA